MYGRKFRQLLLLLLLQCIALCCLSGRAEAQNGFTDPNINAPVNTFGVQADGKISIGGSFTTVGGQPRRKLARLNGDGTLDGSFPDLQVTYIDPTNASVAAIIQDAAGSMWVGGTFTGIGGVARTYIALIDPDGSVHSGYAPAVDGPISAMAMQPDGKMIIAGFFSTVGGLPRHLLARLNPDGTADASFQDPQLTYSGSGAFLQTIALQADGKLLIGGYFDKVAGQPYAWLARLKSDGSLDTTFNPSPDGPVADLIIQPDGRVLASGFFQHIGGGARFAIGRVNSDGSLDQSFAEVGMTSGNITEMALQTDGKVLVAGTFSQIGGLAREGIARVTSGGVVDPSFRDPNQGTDSRFG